MAVSIDQINAEIARRQAAITQPEPSNQVVTPALSDIDAEIARRQLTPEQLPEGGALESVLEPLLTIGSGALGEIAGGVSGLATGLLTQDPKAAEAVSEDVRRKLTIEPSTQAGQAGLETVGEFVQPLGEAFEAAETASGDFIFELTGSPALAALATTGPTAVIEALGLGAIRKARRGTKLLDNAGRPTLALEKILDKKGLNFDNLSDVAKKEIPTVVPAGILPSPKAEIARPAERALIQQIKSGGRDNALATLKVVGNKVQADKLGIEAIKQGFDEGFVQAVKTANTQTKQGFTEMLNTMKRINKSKRLALDIRPSDVVGDSVSSRIKFIRDTATDARKQLNDLAENKLKGRSLDVDPVVTKLQSSLDDLDVKLTGDGIPEPDFTGSLISKDKTSQRVIKDLISLMGEGGKPDALRFHKMKRQIDNMIDFRKKSVSGLSEAGRNVLKDIRSSLNESVRAISPEYARVNDVMSSSLGALDDFQKVSGSSIDIFGKGSNKAIGQDMRGLLSNRKSRVKLENALDSVDTVAKELGGKFNDDVKDLALFANSIEDRFGAVAGTSFKGEIESAIKQAGTQGATAAATEKVFQAASQKAAKLRGVNDFNAFKAMGDLIREGVK